MTGERLDSYTQGLLDRVVVMSKEIGNLQQAYIIANERLNRLTALSIENSKELIEEASRVEDFARLAVEATLLTEQSAIFTNNLELIEGAKKSSNAAQMVHELAVDLRTNKLGKLRDIEKY